MESSDTVSSNDNSSNTTVSNYDEENEDLGTAETTTPSGGDIFDTEYIEPYADEPFADEEWVENYRTQTERANARFEEFEKRLNMDTPDESWCECGLCDVSLLKNPMECYCCKEIPECTNCLEDELVKAEVGHVPVCITLHPGFAACCLSVWSLRLAGTRYKTRQKKQYIQLRSDEAYLRAVAYREFTRLVHGILGKKRIPLPACAYHAIRKSFFSEEEFVGFQDLAIE